jgi:hypothetical protein
VYFVATGALSGGKNANEEVATPGANNLYVAHSDGHGWTTTFIAALSPADRPDWGNEDVTPTLEESTSRVSPNGRYLVFMSERGLTAYNNLDAVSNEPDQEVYEYDSSSNRVICASCNPSGSRPVGVFNGSDLLTARRVFVGSWLAASVPGWYGTNNDIYAPHQPRYLSDSGRLFLDSPEAYALQDTNGVEDVYEYEPDGVGGCGSATGPEGVTAYGGGACLALISGGTGSEESAFVDASASGDDVFLATSQPLVTQDRDTSYDVYDAHVCSTAAPCSAAAPVEPQRCTTAEACRQGAPTLPAFGAPSSTSLSGPGNLAPPVPAKAVTQKSKSLTRAQRLSNALKACKSKARARRKTCVAQARKRYGAKPKTTSKRKGH